MKFDNLSFYSLIGLTYILFRKWVTLPANSAITCLNLIETNWEKRDCPIQKEEFLYKQNLRIADRKIMKKTEILSKSMKTSKKINNLTKN